MNQPAGDAANLAAQLFVEWLAQRSGRDTHLEPPVAVPNTDILLADGVCGDRSLAVALSWVVPPTGVEPWYRAKDDLEQRLRRRLDGGFLLWVPQGAELPEREPHSSEVILRAEEALHRFVAGGHGEVRFPITIAIRKSDAEGSYVTARGGLAPVWARFTNRVFGHFQLDSSDLHRPPAGEGNLTALIDQVVEVANQLELGATGMVATEEAWAARRLRAGHGVALIGEPPGSPLSSGAGLRRALRRTAQTVGAALAERPGGLRLWCIIGPYTAIAQQPVATALLGFDPALYRHLDLIALAAEAEAKPLLDLTRNPALRAAE